MVWRERTRDDYASKISLIERKFGTFPLAALSDRRTRGVFMAWRDRLRCAHRARQADYAWAFWRRVLSWGARPWAHRRRTHARRAGASIRLASRQDLDRTTTRPISWAARLRTCTCRYCSRCGPASAKAICLRLALVEPTTGTFIRLRQMQGWRPRRHPSRSATQGGARRGREDQDGATDPGQLGGRAVDPRWLPRVVAQGVRQGRRRRRDVSRSARHGCDATGAGRLHRGGDRDHHRAQSARRALDPRHATTCTAIRRSPRAAIRKLE